MKIITVIIERIELQNLMPPHRPLPCNIPSRDTDAPMDNRAKLIHELIDTERKYIHSLEELQNYQKEVKAQRLLTKEQEVALFANLSSLLDFQRRFGSSMESLLILPPNEQRIGQLFLDYVSQSH